MKLSSSQKILGNARPAISQSSNNQQQRFNFYPQLAGNLDISVPGSELNGSLGQQAPLQDSAAKRSGRFIKDDSNLIKSRRAKRTQAAMQGGS